MATITPKNPHVAELEVDHYYHLGFSSAQNLPELFGDVRFVLFGGSNDRMRVIAQSFADSFWPLPLGQALEPIGSTTRYHMYKVGPILCFAHGMGMPTFSIMLHETAKLLAAAGAKDVVMIRLGTSGGVGVPGGTIVVTKDSVNGLLEPYYEIPILGKLVRRPSVLDETVSSALLAHAERLGYSSVLGSTMSVDCFYEGQGRLDGAICHYENKDKLEFLAKAHEKGVRNIEMESLMFGAFCQELGIRGGVICCTLLNRLDGDQVTMTPEQYRDWMASVIAVVKGYVAETLGLTDRKA